MRPPDSGRGVGKESEYVGCGGDPSDPRLIGPCSPSGVRRIFGRALKADIESATLKLNKRHIDLALYYKREYLHITAIRKMWSHTHTFNGPFSGTTRRTRVSRYQKGQTNLDFAEEETLSNSGISWAIYKSAPRSRQITTPSPHHSVFTDRMLFLPHNQQRQSTEGKFGHASIYGNEHLKYEFGEGAIHYLRTFVMLIRVVLKINFHDSKMFRTQPGIIQRQRHQR